MATSKTSVEKQETTQSESLLLEQRKVKALEKISNSLDALTVWFEEIEKQDWSDRLQYYLYEFHNNSKAIADNLEALASPTPSEPKEIVSRPKKDSEK
jgi:hypothetical protein